LNTQSCGETKLSRQKKWLIYPDAIDQSNLSGRVRSMAQYLDLMIHDAEVLELSPVWTSFLDDVGHKNVQFRELGSKADFNSATRGQCCG
jgi:phage-related protein